MAILWDSSVPLKCWSNISIITGINSDCDSSKSLKLKFSFYIIVDINKSKIIIPFY